MNKAQHLIQLYEATIVPEQIRRYIAPQTKNEITKWIRSMNPQQRDSYMDTRPIINGLNRLFSGGGNIKIKFIQLFNIQSDSLLFHTASIMEDEVTIKVSRQVIPNKVMADLDYNVTMLVSIITHEITHYTQRAYAAAKIGRTHIPGYPPRAQADRPMMMDKPRMRRRLGPAGLGEYNREKVSNSYMSQPNEINAYAVQAVELVMNGREFGYDIIREYLYRFGEHSPIYKRFMKHFAHAAQERGISNYEINQVLARVKRTMAGWEPFGTR